MDKIETFDNIVNRIKNYEQAMAPPGVPLRHMDEIYKEAAEQYAAQRVQENEEVNNRCLAIVERYKDLFKSRVKELEQQLSELTHERDQLAKLLQTANGAIKHQKEKVAEVTRQRDEAAKLLREYHNDPDFDTGYPRLKISFHNSKTKKKMDSKQIEKIFIKHRPYAWETLSQSAQEDFIKAAHEIAERSTAEANRPMSEQFFLAMLNNKNTQATVEWGMKNGKQEGLIITARRINEDSEVLSEYVIRLNRCCGVGDWAHFYSVISLTL